MPPKLTFPSRAPARLAKQPRAFVNSGGADIDIYDEIGFWGLTAKDLLAKLREVPPDGQVNLRINSPGGDVFEAIAMYSDLIAHPAKVKATVTGVAASAASIICMAADEIAMAPGSQLMIHQAWCFALGNADDLEKTIADLRKVDAVMAEFYAARCGKPAGELAAMMAATTWLGAEEAVAMGLADRVEGSMKTAPEPAEPDSDEGQPGPGDRDGDEGARKSRRARAERQQPQFVKRERDLSVETVAMLERLADKSKEIGYARNA